MTREDEVPFQRPVHLMMPERMARLAYEQYAYEYGTSQSFERLHERGGFGTIEALTLLADLIERERAGRVSGSPTPTED